MGAKKTETGNHHRDAGRDQSDVVHDLNEDEDEGRDVFDYLRQLKERGIEIKKEPERAIAGLVGHILTGDVDFLERSDSPSLFNWAFQAYKERFADETVKLQAELEDITQQLEDVSLELPRQRRNPTVYETLSRRAVELERAQSRHCTKTRAIDAKGRDNYQATCCNQRRYPSVRSGQNCGTPRQLP